MRDRRVLDASAFAAAIFPETFTAAARARLSEGGPLIAPDLIFSELAHVGAKKVRRRQCSVDTVARGLSALRRRLSEIEPTAALAERAVQLADLHGVSGYDGIYVALAEARDAPLLTADLKLIEKLRRAGLADLLDVLTPDGGLP